MATDDCITIPLTRGYSTTVDLEDADLAELKWFAHGPVRPYAYRNPNISMHRVILERILGRKLEEGELCDHIDDNSLNNVRSNLRVATTAQNQHNRKAQRNNRLGVKGVRYNKGIFEARISFNGECIWLGRYKTIEEAHAAYCEASKIYHGDFGRTN